MRAGTDPRAEARIGSVLDEKWTLERLLGSGGMGAVYAARHRNGARSAIKILHPDLARVEAVRERFLREGYAANRVEHRGAVRVLDEAVVSSGPDEGSAYLVMELLEGESLQDRVLHAPPLGEIGLLRITDEVLDVLAAAHEHGVVHRDLKPENIFLAKDAETGDVRVKLLDFGLARIHESSLVTTAGIAVGTPSFMSPEQAAGRGDEIDGRTDLFALGATLFRIVTGRRVHDADNMVQVVTLMATVPAPKLRTVFPDASEAFARVVDGALAFAREDRWRDAATMQRAVREAIAELDQDVPVPVPRRRRRKTTERRRGSTLPWLALLVLGGVVAWKLVPSLQSFLVEASSRFVPPSARTEVDASPMAEPLEDAGIDASDASSDAADDEEAWPEEEPQPPVAPHDAGAPKPRPAPPRASVRPHEAPRTAPTKKPPPPPPPKKKKR
jgi:eukaryotic-like serine/threonine-protein kinase